MSFGYMYSLVMLLLLVYFEFLNVTFATYLKNSFITSPIKPKFLSGCAFISQIALKRHSLPSKPKLAKRSSAIPYNRALLRINNFFL